MERKINLVKIIIFFLLIFNAFGKVEAQSIIKGVVKDAKTGEAVIGATVLIKGTTQGTATDWDGSFIIKTSNALPVNLEVRYSGFATKDISYSTNNKNIDISLEEESIQIEVVEVKGQRISDKQKSSPLTVESMDLLAIKETPAANFYDGLGSLKDVDLTTASLGFTVINTRGFNSTSPVRSLQIIDGVDNQSPGLNFSLGNFLGASELDVNKVDLIVGASSAFYGPNAFNGVISMETKNPFIHKGLSLTAKLGERSLFEGGLRWADAIKNKKKQDVFAYKINLFRMQANDWQADNYDPVYGTESGLNNPGGYDAVNIYGDEYQSSNDLRKSALANPGIGLFHRKGYKESDLVNYNSNNTKASLAFHFRTNPEKVYESPELILSTSYGGGSTVYQGDNRYSLKNIQFFQHRAEFIKKDHYFLRAYYTHENSGDSYDPYFTALLLQNQAKENKFFTTSYINYWNINIKPKFIGLEGYPKVSNFPGNPTGYNQALADFFGKIQDSLFIWHQQTQDFANRGDQVNPTLDYLQPGTNEFKSAFNDITGRIAYSEGGTRFYDKSALLHGQGEYIWKDIYSNEWLSNFEMTMGGSGRMYTPDSKGSILLDTGAANINTYEYGIYVGPSFSFLENALRFNVTARLDKHQNFDYLVSPAASVVYNPTTNNYFRVSFSSAIRNPTLTDQYLHYNVGRAILLGNINGINNLITVGSFVDFLNSGDRTKLAYFNIPAIQPEKVKTIEFGYRTTLLKNVFADLGYYYSKYKDFIGYQIGIDAFIPQGSTTPTSVQAYRVSSNASDVVTTQGFSIGLNYYFAKYYQLKGNYSWNVLNTNSDDPIIPAFNTPEHKYNIGFSGRDLRISKIKNIGFHINYKWIDGFFYESSLQFTGFIPSYSLTDAQINWNWLKQNMTFKLGASNIFNQKNFQTYGGPRVGRLAYFSITYDFKKKIN